MKSTIAILILAAFLQMGIVQAAESASPAYEFDSPALELSPASNDVEISPRYPITRPLPGVFSIQSIQRIENVAGTGIRTPLWLNGEADVESEGDSPSYWPVLGPILITVGVGTATWLLFTLRSS